MGPAGENKGFLAAAVFAKFTLGYPPFAFAAPLHFWHLH